MKQQQLKQFLDFCQSQGFNIQNPESKQRIAVLSNDKSVIPAGAGSGKTTVLTYRFLRLLLDEDIEKIHSNEILTITFTKAATANMKAKIYKLLKKAQKAGLLPEEEIKNFEDAEISTTDSFCAKLVRQDSARYGITSDFVIENQDDLEDFATRTIRRLLNENADDESLQFFYTKYGIADFEEAFKTIATNHIDLTHPFSSDPVALYEECKRVMLEYYNREILEKTNQLQEKLRDFIEHYGHYLNASDDVASTQKILEQLDSGIYPIECSFSKKKTGTKLEEEDTAFKNDKDLIKSIVSDLNIMNTAIAPSELRRLMTYAKLLAPFQQEVLEHKRVNGFLTFHDIMLLSIDILKTNKEIRDRYRKKYKRIMVDEFQDNNEDNKRLVYLLSVNDDYEGPDYPTVEDINLDKIFMVGDEKQSIYRFRGADVSVFKQISQDFGEDRVLALDQNFRSEGELIDTINDLFEDTIMDSNPTEDYEAGYRRLISDNDRVIPTIQFLYMNGALDKKKDNAGWLTDNPKSEAYAVASYIADTIMTHPKAFQVPVRGKDGKWSSRDPLYSDIAILLKTGSKQGDFEKALKIFGIPFNVSDNKSLTMEAVFNDFYNLLQLAVYGKEDLISYAAFLRSPMIGANDASIRNILKAMQSKSQLKEQLSPQDCSLVEDAEELLQQTSLKMQGGSLASLISFIWNELGYRYLIETIEANYAFVEHYDYLFALACDYDKQGKSIIQFLDCIRPMLGETADLKDITIQQEKTSGVTIQSIHKSKGLEYPIVFVCDLSAGAVTDRGLVVHIQEETGIPFFPTIYNEKEDKFLNPYLVLNRNLNIKKENAEMKRVLYVAATRAISHLIFSAVYNTKCVETKKLEDGSTEKVAMLPKADSRNTLLQYLTKGADFSFEYGSDILETVSFDRVTLGHFRNRNTKEMRERETIDSYYQVENKEMPQGMTKLGVTTLIEEPELQSEILGDDFTPWNEHEEVKVLPAITIDSWFNQTDDSLFSNDLSEEEKERLRKEQKSKKITEFGTLTHQMLEDTILGKTNDYGQYFQDEKERKCILESAAKLKDGFFHSSFYTTIQDMEKYPEKEFLVRDGDRLVEGIIDLLCISEDKVVIVDYKTDSVRIDSSHRNQLMFYVNAMKTIYPTKQIEAYVFYLRDPENVLSIQ